MMLQADSISSLHYVFRPDMHTCESSDKCSHWNLYSASKDFLWPAEWDLFLNVLH